MLIKCYINFVLISGALDLILPILLLIMGIIGSSVQKIFLFLFSLIDARRLEFLSVRALIDKRGLEFLFSGTLIVRLRWQFPEMRIVIVDLQREQIKKESTHPRPWKSTFIFAYTHKSSEMLPLDNSIYDQLLFMRGLAQVNLCRIKTFVS